MNEDKSKIRTERINTAIRKIVELFQTGNVPEAIRIVTFPRYDVPSNQWSLLNKLIMLRHGTHDARGYRQWASKKRTVKRGERAFYILAPRMMKVEEKDTDRGEKDEKYICAGFLAVAVFAAHQTDGEPLEYEEIKLPDLPLLEKAREWNIDVQGIPFHDVYYGYYQPGKEERIRLATPSEKTYFHELAHASYARAIGELKPNQDPRQEIVAELAAQTLAQLVGTQIEITLGNSYEYIRKYSADLGKDVGKACVGVIADVEKVLKLILG